jgi:ankyrin repeat protein
MQYRIDRGNFSLLPFFKEVIIIIIMKRYLLFICLLLLTSCLFNDLDSKLLTASSSGNTEDVEAYIFMGADVNIRDEYGKTPLIKAIEHGHIATVKMLLA